jgi:hypothetical protein
MNSDIRPLRVVVRSPALAAAVFRCLSPQNRRFEDGGDPLFVSGIEQVRVDRERDARGRVAELDLSTTLMSGIVAPRVGLARRASGA